MYQCKKSDCAMSCYEPSNIVVILKLPSIKQTPLFLALEISDRNQPGP